MSAQAETAPVNRDILVGVEMERGQITIRVDSGRPGPYSKDKIKGVVAFGSLDQRGRGVRMVLETPLSAIAGPVTQEYVSTPYPATPAGLRALRDAFGAALGERHTAFTALPTLTYDVYGRFQGKTAPHPFAQPLTISVRQEPTHGARITAGIQTTTGVAVRTLMNVRVWEILIGDQVKFKRMMTALELAQRTMLMITSVAAVAPESFEGLFLVCLMHAVEVLSRECSVGLRKDYFGVSLKGHTSYQGCGVREEEVRVLAGIIPGGKKRLWNSVFTAPNTAANQAGWPAWLKSGAHRASADATLLAAVKAKAETQENCDLSCLGHPGRSLQVLSEEKPPIENFLNGGHLYTVVESRQPGSRLNAAIKNMLEGQRGSVDTVYGYLAVMRAT